jgi:hypothetical protein
LMVGLRRAEILHRISLGGSSPFWFGMRTRVRHVAIMYLSPSAVK